MRHMRSYAEQYELKIWAWCLMTNHIHLLAVPETKLSLVRAMGRIHSHHARYRNARLAICGHIWKACRGKRGVGSDGVYRHNPVRTELVDLAGLSMVQRWREALRLGIREEALGERIRAATLTGRPFGSEQPP